MYRAKRHSWGEFEQVTGRKSCLKVLEKYDTFWFPEVTNMRTINKCIAKLEWIERVCKLNFHFGRKIIETDRIRFDWHNISEYFCSRYAFIVSIKPLDGINGENYKYIFSAEYVNDKKLIEFIPNLLNKVMNVNLVKLVQGYILQYNQDGIGKMELERR